jgi:hypothetical protein
VESPGQDPGQVSVGKTSSPTLAKPVTFCGTTTHFLPEVALGFTDQTLVFAGGKVEKDRVVAPVAIAAADFDGSVHEIFADQTSLGFGGAARGADGAI